MVFQVMAVYAKLCKQRHAGSNDRCQGQKQDYIIFVNRSADIVKLGNMSGILSRFTDLQPFYGEFMDDTITVLPYDYTIIKAKFVK